MDTISISKFKATCLAAIDRVGRTGQPLVITKRGVPVAQVIRPPRPELGPETRFGCMAEGTKEVGDVVRPLPPEDWEALG